MREQRSERLALRMAPVEFEMLSKLAEVDGLTHSDVVRLAIRRVYADRFGAAPSAKPRKGTTKAGRRS